MNDRIKELAQQAGMAEAADVRAGYIYPAGMEKFAELIIKEYETLLPGMCPWRDADEEGPMKGWHVAFVARKHFGVE